MPEDRWDALVEAAWRQFRAELADGIDRSAARTVTVARETSDGGLVTLVRVTATEQKLVSHVTAGSALPPSIRPSRPCLARLRALGWSRSTRVSPTYVDQCPLDRVDELAVRLTAVLREVFGVLHPAFLTLDPAAVTVRPSEVSPSEVTRVEVESTAPLPLTSAALPRPRSLPELSRLVEATLCEVLGHEPRRHRDGDVVIGTNDGLVRIQPQDDAPVVRLLADLVVDVADLAEATLAVAELNAEVGGVTFVLDGDVITVSLEALALPYVAEHLLAQVARLCEIVDKCAAVLADRVDGTLTEDDAADPDLTPRPRAGSGRRPESARRPHPGGAEPSAAPVAPHSGPPHPDVIHPVMLRLLQLDADEPDGLSPDDVVELCGHDADLIVELIWWNEEQEIEWRAAREEADAAADTVEAAACEHERHHAHRTVALLRRALRRTLLKR